MAVPNYLHLGHSSCALRQSVSIPGQKYRSRKWSWMCSGPKHPFAICVSRAWEKPSVAGIHSVFATLSLAFELIFHNLLSMIVNPEAWCVAFLHAAGVDPAS